MRRLLLGLYPSSWRARYGDEFEALLEERPLGPFDVADVLLAALDAHLHLRGLTAASDLAKGFVMTLRIGGIAAVLGGLAWAIGLAWASSDESELGLGTLLFLAGTALLLLALVGLSAFQSRKHPRLVWAAFIVPAFGAITSFVGALLMLLPGDAAVVGSLAGWDVWFIGLATLVIGSGLFALASWRTGPVSRLGTALLGAAAIVLVVLAPVMAGLVALPWEPLVSISLVAWLFAFAGGWVVIGIGAIRLDHPVTLATPGGAS